LQPVNSDTAAAAAAASTCLPIQVDVIIDETYSFATGCYVRMTDFVNGHNIASASIRAVANKQVYTIAGQASTQIQVGSGQGSVGLDWYERGTSRADEVRFYTSGYIRFYLPGFDVCLSATAMDVSH
jgi:hypothetical protein